MRDTPPKTPHAGPGNADFSCLFTMSIFVCPTALRLLEDISRPTGRWNTARAVLDDHVGTCGAQVWWSVSGSNRRPPACKAGALPAELTPRSRFVVRLRRTFASRRPLAGRAPRSNPGARPRKARHGVCVRRRRTTQENLVGRDGLEPSTSRLSGVCSNHLSYRPRTDRQACVPRD